MKESLPSIFNDVMGPVMRGPSSSHTAASWRIATTALQLLGESLASALIELPKGSIWASNYREQGTALGMDGGLLQIPMTDDRIMQIDRIAQELKILIEYRISKFEVEHTNTIRVTLTGRSGKSIQVLAISTGGGMFRITSLNGTPIALSGDSYDAILMCEAGINEDEICRAADIPGATCAFTVSDDKSLTIGQITGTASLPGELVDRIRTFDGVKKVSLVTPVLPVAAAGKVDFPFTDFPSMAAFAADKDLSLGALGLIYEKQRSGLSEDALLKKMQEIIDLVESGIEAGLKGTSYTDRILHQQSHLVGQGSKNGSVMSEPMVNDLIANVTAAMEAKSAMEVIVAIPTAGSCGTFGGTVKAFCDAQKIGKSQKVMAYFAGGLVGVFFARGPGFSAEEHGCQVETGAAGCMAAAALAELSGGGWEKASAAASMALQNSIGLVCDPVADRVEVPCLGKNVTAGMNALSASTMAMAGFDPVIPLDQVIETVKKVGRMLPNALCNSGMGGLAITPAAQKLKELLSQICSTSL